MAREGTQGGANGSHLMAVGEAASPDARSRAGRPAADGAGDALLDVVLLDAPIQMIAQEQLRHRDLVREFALMRIGAAADGAPIHIELLSLLDALDRYQAYLAPTRQVIEERYLDGTESMTLVFRVPRKVGPILDRLREVYELVDSYSRDDTHLLTLPPKMSAMRMRRWYLGEFVRQINGEEPLPWDGPLH